MNFDEYKSIGTHWIVSYVKNDITMYFDNFDVGNIPKEIKNFIGNKIIKANIYRIQAYDSIMCVYFCIVLFNSVINNKRLAESTNLFSPNC